MIKKILIIFSIIIFGFASETNAVLDGSMVVTKTKSLGSGRSIKSQGTKSIAARQAAAQQRRIAAGEGKTAPSLEIKTIVAQEPPFPTSPEASTESSSGGIPQHLRIESPLLSESSDRLEPLSEARSTDEAASDDGSSSPKMPVGGESYEIVALQPTAEAEIPAENLERPDSPASSESSALPANPAIQGTADDQAQFPPEDPATLFDTQPSVPPLRAVRADSESEDDQGAGPAKAKPLGFQKFAPGRPAATIDNPRFYELGLDSDTESETQESVTSEISEEEVRQYLYELDPSGITEDYQEIRDAMFGAIREHLENQATSKEPPLHDYAYTEFAELLKISEEIIQLYRFIEKCISEEVIDQLKQICLGKINAYEKIINEMQGKFGKIKKSEITQSSASAINLISTTQNVFETPEAHRTALASLIVNKNKELSYFLTKNPLWIQEEMFKHKMFSDEHLEAVRSVLKVVNEYNPGLMGFISSTKTEFNKSKAAIKELCHIFAILNDLGYLKSQSKRTANSHDRDGKSIYKYKPYEDLLAPVFSNTKSMLEKLIHDQKLTIAKIAEIAQATRSGTIRFAEGQPDEHPTNNKTALLFVFKRLSIIFEGIFGVMPSYEISTLARVSSTAQNTYQAAKTAISGTIMGARVGASALKAAWQGSTTKNALEALTAAAVGTAGYYTGLDSFSFTPPVPKMGPSLPSIGIPGHAPFATPAIPVVTAPLPDVQAIRALQFSYYFYGLMAAFMIPLAARFAISKLYEKAQGEQDTSFKKIAILLINYFRNSLSVLTPLLMTLPLDKFMLWKNSALYQLSSLDAPTDIDAFFANIRTTIICSYIVYVALGAVDKKLLWKIVLKLFPFFARKGYALAKMAVPKSPVEKQSNQAPEEIDPKNLGHQSRGPLRLTAPTNPAQAVNPQTLLAPIAKPAPAKPSRIAAMAGKAYDVASGAAQKAGRLLGSAYSAVAQPAARTASTTASKVSRVVNPAVTRAAKQASERLKPLVEAGTQAAVERSTKAADAVSETGGQITNWINRGMERLNRALSQ